MKRKLFLVWLTLMATILGVVVLLSACRGPTNEVPVILSISGNPATIAPGGSSTITCTASDPDGDRLSYSWSATEGSLTGTGEVITWVAPAAAAGTYTISVTVDDGKGGIAGKSYTIAVVVTGTNRPPVIVSLKADPKTIEPFTRTTITCVATDPDGDLLTYRWVAAEGDIEGTGNTVTWTAPLRLKQYAIEVTVQDNKGGYANGACLVTVAPNELPTIRRVTVEPEVVIPDESATVTCVARDLDGDPLTYTWSASGGSLSGAGDVVKWTAPGSAGYFTIKVTIDDGRGGTVTASVTVQVRGIKLTTRLQPVDNESGCVYSDGSVYSSWRVGDDNANNGIRTYLSFDLSDITGVAEFRSATLKIETIEQNGTPWADLGGLSISQVEYGARSLRATDYDLQSTRLQRLDSPTITEIDVSPIISQALQDKESRFQITLYFLTETDRDSLSDHVRVATAELTVNYVEKG